jgi:Acyl-CoA carboxylase epsilon subunit
MDEEPLVGIVRGTPSPEELAALVGVLTSLTSRTQERSPRPAVSAWSASGRPGTRPASWRASGLPR